MSDPKDPYQVLGVARSASPDDIRRAYRKLARATHPDVKPGDKAAEERFKEISQAYDVLSDSKKRSLYDEFGAMGLREGFNAEQARAFSRGPGGFSGAGGQPGASGFDLGDLFGDFFGGQSSSAGPARGADVSATVEVSLAEALRGTEIVLDVPGEVSCDTCHGSGRRPGARPARCELCRGGGQVSPPGMPSAMRMRCSACAGRGQSQPPCAGCHGKGTQARADRITVRIPPGTDHRSKLRVAARGGRGRGGRGDLIIETRVRPHPWFRRDGLDLIVRLPLTVHEAVAGALVTIPTPTGSVNLRVPRGAQPGLRLRLRGRGVARGSLQGDLFAEVEVRMPDAQSDEANTAAQALDRFYGQPVRQELAL